MVLVGSLLRVGLAVQAARSFAELGARGEVRGAAAEVLEILGLMHEASRRLSNQARDWCALPRSQRLDRGFLGGLVLDHDALEADRAGGRPRLRVRPISAQRRVIWRRERPVRDSTSLTVCA
jgi:hypothetical protein